MVSTGDVTKGTSQRHKEVIVRVAGQLVPPLIESFSPKWGHTNMLRTGGILRDWWNFGKIR